MKMEVVQSVPRIKRNLQAMLVEFMAMDASCVRLTPEGYKSAAVARNVISVAVARSGYPIKVFKRGDYVYLSKIA